MREKQNIKDEVQTLENSFMDKFKSVNEGHN